MTLVADTPGVAKFDQRAFEAFLTQRNEPSWLVDRRRSAWELFQNLSWPSRSEEEWARTDIRVFRLDDFQFPGAGRVTADVCNRRALLTEGVEFGGQVWTHDGQSAGGALRPDWAARGVVFAPLCDPSTLDLPAARNLLERTLIAPETDRFASLCSALWSGGALLYVPRGLHIDQPLHVISALTNGASEFTRLVVLLEEGAEATLLTELQSDQDDSRGLHCGTIELHLSAGARLRFVSLQNWGTGVWHFAHHKAVLGRDAVLQWTSAALGSRLSKVNQHVLLRDPGAESQVNGVLFTQGRQHLSYHTLQHHQAPHCRSDFLYKAALQDQSRTVWRGMIKVDPGAQQTDGYQRNDNLMLSAHCRADSIPGLEIQADDVRCTHGSTSGRVDEELIFYAQSRGFTRQEAIRMIVTGFFQQVFDRITIDSVREALGSAIARRVREYK